VCVPTRFFPDPLRESNIFLSWAPQAIKFERDNPPTTSHRAACDPALNVSYNGYDNTPRRTPPLSNRVFPETLDKLRQPWADGGSVPPMFGALGCRRAAQRTASSMSGCGEGGGGRRMRQADDGERSICRQNSIDGRHIEQVEGRQRRHGPNGRPPYA
jgi:hypothetical protein